MFATDVGLLSVQQPREVAARQFIKYRNTREIPRRRGEEAEEKQKIAHTSSHRRTKKIWTKPFRILSDLFKRMECSANDLVDAGHCYVPEPLDLSVRNRNANCAIRFHFVFLFFFFSTFCMLPMSRFNVGRRAIANILNVRILIAAAGRRCRRGRHRA